MTIDHDSLPVPARGVRMRIDPQTHRPILLYPEGVLPLDDSTCEIFRRCTGESTVRRIVESLAEEFDAEADVLSRQTIDCLEQLREQLLIELLPAPRPAVPIAQMDLEAAEDTEAAPGALPRPLLLLAEVTYRCPLHCPYCSNPSPIARRPELSTADWIRVLNEAAEAGVLHAGFSGGEPLLRGDIVELVSAARSDGLYTNLITSAVGFTPRRAEQLKAAGLDSVQISFQSDEPSLADRVAGTKAHQLKLDAARLTRELGFPLTVNVVLHRANISRVEQIIQFAAGLGAERLELANTQYYGWAFRNRAALLPTREQIEHAARASGLARKQFAGQMDILFVKPDYYTERPKPCMHGWGSRYLTVNSFGDALPCPTAGEIKELRFDNVQSRSISWIWKHSEAFNRFRGKEWMPETCKQCAFNEIDFGGCRCQAALILGDASAVDPACSLAPGRAELTRFVESCQSPAEADDVDSLAGRFVFRDVTAAG